MGGAPLVFVDFDLSCSKVIYKIPFFESFTSGGSWKNSLFVFDAHIWSSGHETTLQPFFASSCTALSELYKNMFELFLLKNLTYENMYFGPKKPC